MSRQIRHLYEFGPFRLDPEKPCLWRDGEPVQLTPKAVETLLVLIQQNGKLVEREDLMSAIWPETFVEDGNLNFNVSMLRKALGTDEAGEQYIQTVPRHGYRFRADVRQITEEVPVLIVEKHARARIVIEEREIPTTAELEVEKPGLPPGLPIRKYLGIYAGGAFALLLAIGAVLWFLLPRDVKQNQLTGAVTPPVQSIAVLPLKPLSGEESDRTLSLGLTDTLVTRLGSLRSIVVLPVSNAGVDPNPIEIGRKLKVDAVLEATLQRTDLRFRINARLLRVGDGRLIWSASFDENDTDLFKLQDALSLQVTESLGARLNPKERELLTRHDTQNREAFHAYWRGRFFLEKRNPEKAIAEFQQTINLDPNYALAYTGLADAYIWQASFTNSADRELYGKAKTAIDKALELNPNLADAHSSLGRIKHWYTWDWKGAEKSFLRAIELNPNSVNAHQFYSRLLTTLGRYDESLSEMYKAQELDPHSADLGVPLSVILENRGEFDEALRVLQSTLEMDKDSRFARRGIANAYLLKGDYAKVIELGKEEFPNPRETDFAWASMLATAYYKTGQTAKATDMRNHLKKLAEKDPKSLFFLALHDSELGRTDEAVAALWKCIELREERVVTTKGEPRFASIKADPRFQAILQQLNLAN
ncbi:MAG TPA: winged helix-turn-helix domain-containing protein [Pyrinomonadaceae bacterium]|jgi:DNA-binding winged helix-turn-helix (wHTH) protein/tetratricopeptide (TPR) repeat protein